MRAGKGGEGVCGQGIFGMSSFTDISLENDMPLSVDLTRLVSR